MNFSANNLYSLGPRRAVQSAYENLSGEGVHKAQAASVEFSVPCGGDEALQYQKTFLIFGELFHIVLGGLPEENDSSQGVGAGVGEAGAAAPRNSMDESLTIIHG
ncbi:MAG: hypothetical protein K2O57_00805 [Acetatifactor sp.]|nr:hypothetical protein [Acetatifactor sp.]